MPNDDEGGTCLATVADRPNAIKEPAAEETAVLRQRPWAVAADER